MMTMAFYGRYLALYLKKEKNQHLYIDNEYQW